MTILLLWRISTPAAEPDQLGPIAKPSCETHCGDVSIPYPFGIGPSSSCYLYDWFEIHCDNSTSPHKPFLRVAKLEVLNISIEGTLLVKNPVTFFFNRRKTPQAPNLTGSPILYSQKYNRFTAVSCGFFALVRSYRDERVVGGCMSTCDKSAETGHNHGCIGINCCQTTLPKYLSVIETQIKSESEESSTSGNDRMFAAYAFLVDQDWFQNNLSNFRDVKDMESVPVVLEWSLSLENMNSSLIELFRRFITNTSEQSNFGLLMGFAQNSPYCRIHNVTSSTYNRSMLQCFCPPGFQGSPYLLQPCQDIDECKGPNMCPDPGLSYIRMMNFGGPTTCENFAGGHSCYSYTTGVACDYYGTGVVLCQLYGTGERRWLPVTSRIKTILLGLGMGLGLLLLFLGAWYGAWHVYKIIKKRKDIKRKEIFFKRNGGLLLEKQLSSGEHNVEKVKLFKSKELEKSTDNFNINRILGQGAQGTVFKGMLTDGRIVAVKKSKIVDEGKLSEFINEVVILSQINHRNVVKILGCCLETEVPILVYEFIPNGTLSQYIQGKIEECSLTWKMRIRIATEIAGALFYLHGAASFLIFHRDIKSSNILLDEKYRAKVADFGTSRSIATDQTHLTTLVNGTFGYLDPEYFQSNRFTEKSDVYSFGVVLVVRILARQICPNWFRIALGKLEVFLSQRD
ncbi:wall-associated receptor kinase-like 1 [Prunus yedoensis var. nudiflora]|uniref:Wall-associated receptor kinase-like 1 n=1 Tax=Prunus yedoensis var. nudiflora TaxID=2094558 RepID=A0A314Y1X1_PRUYE|nr:wall-associated receptor kinase-like 1 [Prunus yedoensis var. nudiflora]